jgi:hypothetical protein
MGARKHIMQRKSVLLRLVERNSMHAINYIISLTLINFFTVFIRQRVLLLRLGVSQFARVEAFDSGDELLGLFHFHICKREREGISMSIENMCVWK